MKCIKEIKNNKTEDYEILRVANNIAEKAVASGKWRYTSKSKYKSHIRNLLPKFSSGIQFSMTSYERELAKKNRRKGRNGKHNKAYRIKHFQLIDMKDGTTRFIKHI
jgi:hypothetical protein